MFVSVAVLVLHENNRLSITTYSVLYWFELEIRKEPISHDGMEVQLVTVSQIIQLEKFSGQELFKVWYCE